MSGPRARGLSRERNQLARSLRRYREGKITAEQLATSVEWFLSHASLKIHGDSDVRIN